jgi:hypothetical protein
MVGVSWDSDLYACAGCLVGFDQNELKMIVGSVESDVLEVEPGVYKEIVVRYRYGLCPTCEKIDV